MASQRSLILTMNRGLASLKSALYLHDKRIASIKIEQVAASKTRLQIVEPGSPPLVESIDSTRVTLDAVFTWLHRRGYASDLIAVGHRLVHWGARYRTPQLLTPAFVSILEELVPVDPYHLPPTIDDIRAIAGQFPDLPQVGCFDTAFHMSLPQVAQMYALPRRLYDEGIVRYGFHGLSYEYIVDELRKIHIPLHRLIIAHLGDTASMVAVKDGQSVDTSMGFTPLEGLVMCTWPGDLDPGVILYLLEREKVSPEELDVLLLKQSGLLGISTLTGDMRSLLAMAPTEFRAADAVDLFCYRAKKYLGSYAAVLGGLETLVFTGGIGAHCAAVRERICTGLEFLGIRIDPARNAANRSIISTSKGSVHVRVMETNENLMIVRNVRSMLGRKHAAAN